MTNIWADIIIRLVLFLGLGFIGTKIIIYSIDKILSYFFKEI